MRYTLMDLFAGIGGIRLGFEQTGKVNAIFSSEIENHAREYYTLNFGDTPEGDITKIPLRQIPYADIIAGGVPCQAFSHMGKRKGLEDDRGKLFYRFAEIVRAKQPKAFFVENVRGLVTHDKGRTFEKIIGLFKRDIGYSVYYHMYNSAEWGVPHTRRRVYIVGFKEDVPFFFPSSFDAMNGDYSTVAVKHILEQNVHRRYYVGNNHCRTFERHIAMGKKNGYSAEMVSLDGYAKTLTCGEPKKNLIQDVPLADPRAMDGDPYTRNDKGIRYFTPREMARLQAFPESFIVPESGNSAAKLFGNSVTVEVVYRIANAIVKTLDRYASNMV